MAETQNIIETKLLYLFRLLPIEKRTEVMDFVMFINRLNRETTDRKNRDESERGENIVEKTWGTIPLDKKTLMYIAEDKELEYEI